MSFKVKTYNAGISFQLSVKINKNLTIFLYPTEDSIYFLIYNNRKLIPKYGYCFWIVKTKKTISYG